MSVGPVRFSARECGRDDAGGYRQPSGRPLGVVDSVKQWKLESR
jgi:hypothetical protein